MNKDQKQGRIVVKVAQILVGLASFSLVVLLRREFGIRHFAEHGFDTGDRPKVGLIKRWTWPVLAVLYIGVFYIIQRMFENGESGALFIGLGIAVLAAGYIHLVRWERADKTEAAHSLELGINSVVVYRYRAMHVEDQKALSNRIELIGGGVICLVLCLVGFVTAGLYFGIGTLALAVKMLAVREKKVQKNLTINDSDIEDERTRAITAPGSVQGSDDDAEQDDVAKATLI